MGSKPNGFVSTSCFDSTPMLKWKNTMERRDNVDHNGSWRFINHLLYYFKDSYMLGHKYS